MGHSSGVGGAGLLEARRCRDAKGFNRPVWLHAQRLLSPITPAAAAPCPALQLPHLYTPCAMKAMEVAHATTIVIAHPAANLRNRRQSKLRRPSIRPTPAMAPTVAGVDLRRKVEGAGCGFAMLECDAGQGR